MGGAATHGDRLGVSCQVIIVDTLSEECYGLEEPASTWPMNRRGGDPSTAPFRSVLFRLFLFCFIEPPTLPSVLNTFANVVSHVLFVS